MNDEAWAREYLYYNLMRHVRKKSYLRELRSCWEIMAPKFYVF